MRGRSPRRMNKQAPKPYPFCWHQRYFGGAILTSRLFETVNLPLLYKEFVIDSCNLACRIAGGFGVPLIAAVLAISV